MLIVMKFGGTSVGSAERIAQAAALVTAARDKGHHVAAVTSAMSGVTNSLIEAAQAASKGNLDSTLRQRLFDRHKAGADAGIQGAAVRAVALEQIDRRLDRFEKLCYGLSMVHELTPRLLDAISGTGQMPAAPLRAPPLRAPPHRRRRRGVIIVRCHGAHRHDRPVGRRGAADGRHAPEDPGPTLSAPRAG